MGIDVAIYHRTTYRFDRLVKLSPHIVRLRPAPHCRTPIKAYSLRVEPGDHFINWQQDPFGNYLARLVFPNPASWLSVEVELIADMTVINPFDFFLDDYAEKRGFAYGERLSRDLTPYLEVVEDGPRLRDWVAARRDLPERTIDFLVSLNRQLREDVDYAIRMEPGVQDSDETLARGIGSCRDSAWLLVQVLRHFGLAARFVSGYLVQLVADQKPLDGPSGPEADFTDLHAWAEVYLPGAGWVGLDPTSGLFAGEGHIPLACTPDPGSAAPVVGYTDPCEVDFDFENKVTRFREHPRVTRPVGDEQWAAIEALAGQVDAALEGDDVRLTMGGEPTFVSVDDMDADEWNTAADGDHKRRLAEDLLRRMAAEFAPGALLHYGEGKWYPGERLPRWKKSAFWRRDGIALWQRADLLARPDRALGHGDDEARALVDGICRELGFPRQCVVPACEDALYHAWKERRLPSDVSLEELARADEPERRRLVRLFSQGLDSVAGYVLPLAWCGDEGRDAAFVTSPWPLRDDRLTLIEGDSPLGLRLPLDALPWHLPAVRAPEPQDPFAPRGPLAGAAPDGNAPGVEQRTDQVVHTALCVEVRDGLVHVFMPPLGALEGFVALLGAVERSATALNLPLVIEGYEPPPDPRLEHFAVTPDPGVIEVNIHPSSAWEELRERTSRLYELAREVRLGTEKFNLDGKHTGTGGGNHMVLGGAQAADSPFLRRPDLLRSLITFWQHHPALSYLFSGQFVGPTSQAPRVDEARDDNLYELEIALAQVPDGPDECRRPWLVDRLLRHLLTDLTGNTHRAEFCIDKMYPPAGAGDRRGLLELRAFEMPPHARMALLQALLVRALVATFWRTPYKRPPIRWGTGLHDKFLLPYYCWRDFVEVLAELRERGFDFDPGWFDAFFEFRFPHYGTRTLDDVSIELRGAIEPWHVLGEEMTNSGTARYVDSSVERLQIRAAGMTPGRHLVTCNGRRVPMWPTDVPGEYVGGVRYKAWQPPSGLHPELGVDPPLVIDLVDAWNGRSRGGCTYHVYHSGGRDYQSFPVNAYEAESRRAARFWDFGHSMAPPAVEAVAPRRSRRDRFEAHAGSAGPFEMPGEADGPEAPHTLDLRWRR